MDEQKVVDLYIRERRYQKCMFGDYRDLKSLNLASFLNFIRGYLKKAEEAYRKPWQRPEQLPEWLKNCRELKEDGFAPVQVYEELIKIFALSGAALFANGEFDPEKWRVNPFEEGQKWIEADPSILEKKENCDNE